MAINFSASFAACLAAGLKVPRQIMYCIAQGKNKFFDKWHLYRECESVRCTLMTHELDCTHDFSQFYILVCLLFSCLQYFYFDIRLFLVQH